MEVFKFNEGGICEEFYIYFIKDYVVEPNIFHSCRHCKDGVNPLVVQVVNEGGDNSTLAGVRCIVEAAKEIRRNT